MSLLASKCQQYPVMRSLKFVGMNCPVLFLEGFLKILEPLTSAILLLLCISSWQAAPLPRLCDLVASKIHCKMSNDFCRHETEGLCSEMSATTSQNSTRTCRFPESKRRGAIFSTKLSANSWCSEFLDLRKCSISIIPSSFFHSLPSLTFPSRYPMAPVNISRHWLKDSPF